MGAHGEPLEPLQSKSPCKFALPSPRMSSSPLPPIHPLAPPRNPRLRSPCPVHRPNGEASEDPRDPDKNIFHWTKYSTGLATIFWDSSCDEPGVNIKDEDGESGYPYSFFSNGVYYRREGSEHVMRLADPQGQSTDAKGKSTGKTTTTKKRHRAAETKQDKVLEDQRKESRLQEWLVRNNIPAHLSRQEKIKRFNEWQREQNRRTAYFNEREEGYVTKGDIGELYEFQEDFSLKRVEPTKLSPEELRRQRLAKLGGGGGGGSGGGSKEIRGLKPTGNKSTGNFSLSPAERTERAMGEAVAAIMAAASGTSVYV